MPVAAPAHLSSPPPARARRIAVAALAAAVLGGCAGTGDGAGHDDEADPAPIVAAVTAVIDASNAEDADAFRALVCRAEVGRFTDLTDADPVDDPVRLADVTVVAQGTDSASAEVVLATGEGAGEITQVIDRKSVV